MLLAIEVCDSSLAYDRDIKTALYASFSIAEVWLVDTINQQLTQYRQPDGDHYQVVSQKPSALNTLTSIS